MLLWYLDCFIKSLCFVIILIVSAVWSELIAVNFWKVSATFWVVGEITKLYEMELST